MFLGSYGIADLTIPFAAFVRMTCIVLVLVVTLFAVTPQIRTLSIPIQMTTVALCSKKVALAHGTLKRASLGVLTLGARLVLAGLAQSGATMAHTAIERCATQITKVTLVEVPCHVLDEHVMTMHQHHIQHFCFLRGVALEKQGVLMVQCERADREPLRTEVCLKLFQGVLPGWHVAFHSRWHTQRVRFAGPPFRVVAQPSQISNAMATLAVMPYHAVGQTSGQTHFISRIHGRTHDVWIMLHIFHNIDTCRHMLLPPAATLIFHGNHVDGHTFVDHEILVRLHHAIERVFDHLVGDVRHGHPRKSNRVVQLRRLKSDGSPLWRRQSRFCHSPPHQTLQGSVQIVQRRRQVIALLAFHECWRRTKRDVKLVRILDKDALSDRLFPPIIVVKPLIALG